MKNWAGRTVYFECAHPLGTHANSCRRSELEILRQQLQELVSILKEAECYDPEKSLADQLRQALRRG